VTSMAPTVCRMFNDVFDRQRQGGPPRYLSADHDPLFEFHRWKANLRILEIDEIKTIPHVPVFHPFVERLIGTTRRGFLDHVLFWNSRDRKRKLTPLCQQIFNITTAEIESEIEPHRVLDDIGRESMTLICEGASLHSRILAQRQLIWQHPGL
jgi:hypothetical protein